MNFHWPHAFWLLLIPLTLAVLQLRRRRASENGSHPKILRAEAGSHHLSLVPNSTAGKTARFRWRLWLGLALAIVAFARPQWGRLDEPVFDQAREIIIALDLSRSMLADDVRPSRLERAKLLVSSLLEQLRGERVGLVVFSGTAFLQSPLSSDYEILRDFLPGLNPSYLPEGGTNYTALLNTSLTAFGASGSADRFLIVLSDGEATDDDWKPLATELKTKGIRVISLGVGTTAGAMIPDGTGAFVKDERGAVVLSKLEGTTLQQLATETNGLYANASSWVDISQLLQATVETGRKGAFVERSHVRLTERYQWALAPALLLLFLSFWRDFPVRPRLRDVKLVQPTPTPPPLPVQQVPADAKAVATSAAALLLIAFTFSLITQAPAARAAEEKETSPAEPLSKLVANLSQRPNLAARDYAEFARTTLAYGQRLQSSQKHVPAGPVNDALAGVDAGEALDAKAADWPTLRRDLEALLKKKDPPPPEQQQQSPQQKKEEQQKKDQQQQQQDQQKQNSQPKEQEKPQEKSEQQQPGDKTQQPPPPKQGAFGDMKEKSAEKSDQPPPSSDPTEQQKVGGAPEKKEGSDNKDPALAVPLQKLDELKNQDSPVQLYQLMQGKPTAPKKPAKDW
jgi:Ca-activated chloride channel family protein